MDRIGFLGRHIPVLAVIFGFGYFAPPALASDCKITSRARCICAYPLIVSCNGQKGYTNEANMASARPTIYSDSNGASVVPWTPGTNAGSSSNSSSQSSSAAPPSTGSQQAANEPPMSYPVGAGNPAPASSGSRSRCGGMTGPELQGCSSESSSKVVTVDAQSPSASSDALPTREIVQEAVINGDGINGRVVVPALRSQAGSGQAREFMMRVVAAANKDCFDTADGEGMAIAGLAVLKMKTSDGSSMLDASESALFNSAAGTAANTNKAKRCQWAKEVCERNGKKVDQHLSVQSDAANMRYKTYYQANNQAAAFREREEFIMIHYDRKVIGRIQDACATVYGAQIKAASGSAGSMAEGAAQAQTVYDAVQGGASGSGWSRSDVKTAAGIGIIALGTAGIIASNRSSSKGKPANVAAEAVANDARAAYEAQVAEAAEKDPGCLSNRAFEFSHCQAALRSDCATKAAQAQPRCRVYTDNYCGINKNADVSAAAKTSQGGGVGSVVCENRLAADFCAQADRQACYSCAGGVAATNESMTRFRQSCPTDPVFMQARWRHLAPDSGTGIQPSNANFGIMGRDPASR